MTKEQAIDQCRKIYELVKRGVGGEKDSAKKRLHVIMAKHGIELHDVEGEKIVEASLVCTEDEEMFARQVVASVLGKGVKKYKFRKRLYFDAPVSKITEITDRWEHYKKLYRQEKEIFYSAFIQKHKLYVKPDPHAPDSEDQTPLTREEKERLRKMFQMMEGMEYSDYKKKLNI